MNFVATTGAKDFLKSALDDRRFYAMLETGPDLAALPETESPVARLNKLGEAMNEAMNIIGLPYGSDFIEDFLPKLRATLPPPPPSNPDTGRPYFIVPQDGWGGQPWKAGEKVVINIEDTSDKVLPDVKELDRRAGRVDIREIHNAVAENVHDAERSLKAMSPTVQRERDDMMAREKAALERLLDESTTLLLAGLTHEQRAELRARLDSIEPPHVTDEAARQRLNQEATALAAGLPSKLGLQTTDLLGVHAFDPERPMFAGFTDKE
jgi:hypothetical protein